jgi:DNA polymerase V
MKTTLSKSQELRVSVIEKVRIGKRVYLPVAICAVPAGFPSPADDYIEKDIDLNEWLIDNKLATFLVRVDGDSMNDEIHSGDRLIVDRSIEPKQRDIVVACLDGEMTVKRFIMRDDRIFLAAENSHYSEIEITGESELIIWGVVTHCIHSFVNG